MWSSAKIVVWHVRLQQYTKIWHSNKTLAIFVVCFSWSLPTSAAPSIQSFKPLVIHVYVYIYIYNSKYIYIVLLQFILDFFFSAFNSISIKKHGPPRFSSSPRSGAEDATLRQRSGIFELCCLVGISCATRINWVYWMNGPTVSC